MTKLDLILDDDLVKQIRKLTKAKDQTSPHVGSQRLGLSLIIFKKLEEVLSEKL